MESVTTKSQATKKYFINFLSFLVPSLVSLVYSVPAFKDTIKGVLTYAHLYEFIVFIKIPLIIVLMLLVPWIALKLESKIGDQSTKVQLERALRFISSISNIVSEKRKRFQSSISKIPPPRDEAAVFREITQPRIQMTEILKNLVVFFDKITGDDTIKAALISCSNDQLMNFFMQTEDLPSVSIDSLNSNKSTAKVCLSSKKPKIVHDTQKKRIFWDDNGQTNIKAIICYPVKHGNQVDYILSITSKKANTFVNIGDKAIFEFLKEYEHRICLEHYLLILKGEA